MLYAYLWLKTWLNQEEGQDLIEYVLIAGLVALAAVVGITAVGTQLQIGWNALATQVNNAVP
jgi:pilus assembly protein Flp/PilA